MIPHYSEHAANERTYLAWIRTSIAVMAFGFLVEKLELAFGARLGHPHDATDARILGLLLVGIGILMMGGTTIRYFMIRKSIEREKAEPYTSLPGILLTLFPILTILVTAGYLIRQFS